MTLSLHITLTRTPYAHAKDSAQPCAFETRKTLSLLSQQKVSHTPSPNPLPVASLFSSHTYPLAKGA